MNRHLLDEFHREYYDSHVWQRTFWLGVALTSVSPAGSESATLTFVAASGP